MISKAFKQYADNHWKTGFQATVSELSASDGGKPCVQNDTMMFSFDKIVGSKYAKNKKPTSADALFFKEDKIAWLIEFKQGLQHSLTRQNAEDVSDWEKRFRKKEREELKKAIFLKAIQSYIFLEKMIFNSPSMPACKQKMHIKYLAVVDVNPITAYESMLGDLATPVGKPKKTCDAKSVLDALKDSLKRLQGNKDAAGVDYFYDSATAISCQEFCSYLCLPTK